MTIFLKQFAQYFSFAIVIATFFLVTTAAAAQVVINDGPLSVSFSQLPLFSASSDGVVAPGQTLAQDVTVTSSSADLETLLLSATNTISSILSDQTIVTVIDSQTQAVYFAGTATEWFGDSPLTLGLISSGSPRDFKITLSFATSSGNTYQGTSFAFDLAVGFQGGPTVTVPGGGGGGSFIPTPGTPNPTTPDGQVAGITTDTNVPLWWQPIVGAVTQTARAVDSLIASALVDEDDVDSDPTQEGMEATGQVAGESDEITEEERSINNGNCTLWWLWLLALLSIIATGVEFLRQRTSPFMRRLFVIHLISIAVFAVVAYIAFLLGWLSSTIVPVIFVGVWVLIYTFDSFRHAKLVDYWQPHIRSLIMIFGSILLLILHWLAGWPCVWWPFIASLFVSIVLFFRYE